MAEWSNAVASKAIIPCKRDRGFESPSLLYKNLGFPMINRMLKLLSISLLFSAPIFSMVCDNQYFPLFQRPFSRIIEQPSRFAIDAFFTTASLAFDNKENEIEIPALFGPYDQNKLSNALTLVGKNNPLPAEFRGSKIEWDISGKIQAQGVSIAHEQKLLGPVYVGFSWLLMHAYSCHDFCLKSPGMISEIGDIQELKEARRLMHKELGLTQMQSSRTGMGDFDCYLRIGGIWDYKWKCRRIDAGLTLGLLMPSGLSREICNATTVPFGGNGHWGAYGRLDAEFELKEDMKFGLSMRIGKRFERTMDMRLPVAKEHPLFGALVTPVSVDPGLNFSFFPYVSLENLRKGLGVRIGLNLNKHSKDYFCDLRSSKEREDLPAITSRLKKVSEWSSDYASLNVFYDFGKMAVERGYKPIVTFGWDVPFLMFVASNSIKTHRISLGVEFNF